MGMRHTDWSCKCTDLSFDFDSFSHGTIEIYV